MSFSISYDTSSWQSDIQSNPIYDVKPPYLDSFGPIPDMTPKPKHLRIHPTSMHSAVYICKPSIRSLRWKPRVFSRVYRLCMAILDPMSELSLETSRNYSFYCSTSLHVGQHTWRYSIVLMQRWHELICTAWLCFHLVFILPFDSRFSPVFIFISVCNHERS